MSDPSDHISFPITLRHEHRLIFTRDVFAEDNPVLADVLTPREPGESVRAMVFWDAGLAAPFPDIGQKIARWFEAQADRVRLAAPARQRSGRRRREERFCVNWWHVWSLM